MAKRVYNFSSLEITNAVQHVWKRDAEPDDWNVPVIYLRPFLTSLKARLRYVANRGTQLDQLEKEAE